MASPPPKKQRIGEQQTRWVKLQADNYEALVSLATIKEYSDSVLATRVQLEMEKYSGCPDVIPAVRWDFSPAVVKEVVDVLRQGSRYEAPRDDPRLLKELLHTLDYLGLPTPQVACDSSHEVLMIPNYSACSAGMGDEGICIYSANCQGWAQVQGEDDPRPSHAKLAVGSAATRPWLAAVLRSELTNAGEDMVYMLPNGLCTDGGKQKEAFMLRASLKALPFTAPPKHKACASMALAAARGKLFVLGGVYPGVGDPLFEGVDCSTLEVADAFTGVWFSAPSPLSRNATLEGHAMLSNKAEGMLLVLGGRAETHLAPGTWHDAPADVWDANMVAKYDIRAGSWSKHPSGCALPAAPGNTCMAAVAADEHTIMMLRITPPVEVLDDEAVEHLNELAVSQPLGRVDLLDLRMWRWREGAALQRDCLHGVGLVEYDGKLLAAGGSNYRWPVLEQMNDWEPIATDVVSSYDLRTDSWSELPPRLPLALCYSCPVVLRMPGVHV